MLTGLCRMQLVLRSFQVSIASHAYGLSDMTTARSGLRLDAAVLASP